MLRCLFTISLTLSTLLFPKPQQTTYTAYLPLVTYRNLVPLTIREKSILPNPDIP